MSTCYRNHLKKDHKEIYESTIQLKNLKHAKDVSASPALKDTPYTKEKFEFLLCRWIVTDDQVCNWLTCFFYCITKTFASPSTFSSLQNSESSCYFWAMGRLRRRTSLIGPRWQPSFWTSSRRSGINLHKTWGRRKGVFHTRQIYGVTRISILLWRLQHTTCFARKLDSLNIGAGW